MNLAVVELSGFLALLTNFYFHLVLLTPLAVYLTVGCGVCDTNPSAAPDLNDSDGTGDAQSSKSRDSSGFDINPAISPVYEKNGIDSASDWNVFGESIGELSWWNAKILGTCGGGVGGGSSTL